MTMQFDANFTPATHAEAIFRLKAKLKSVGWVVQASGDGLAAFSTTPGNVNDQITSFGSGANGLANDDAWFVIKKPDDNHQFCFKRGPDNTRWQVLYSVSAGFTGGTPSPTQTPIASDMRVLAGALNPPDSWTTVAQMTVARTQAAIATLQDGRIIVAGGWNNGGVGVADVEIYDPSNNTWTTKASMPAPRSHAGYAVLPNGKLLVAGGYLSGTPTSTAVLYDPTGDSWSATGSMSTTRVSTFAPELMNNECVLISAGPYAGKVIFCPGGQTTSYPGPEVTSSEIYDPGSGTWGSIAALPGPGYPASASIIVPFADGRIFLYTGQDTITDTTCVMWLPASNTWSPIASIPNPAYNSKAVRLTAGPDAGKVIVIAGWSAVPFGNTNVTQIYDPTLDSWAPGPSLNVQRSGFAYGLTAQGDPIVVGGATGFLFSSGYTSSTEILDQTTMTWVQDTFMNTAAFQQVGLTLASSYLGPSRFIVVGGYFNNLPPFFVFPATQILTPGPTTRQLSRYRDGKTAFSIAADDTAPFGFWAGGYGKNLDEWFRAGGSGMWQSDGNAPGYQNVPDVIAHAPSSRAWHAMAFDRARNVTVLFGGETVGGDSPTETWLWNGDYWRAATTTKFPPWRKLHAMAYDITRQRVVLFGGYDGSTMLDDVWEWDGVAWTRVTPAPGPAARANTRLVWSPALGKIVLFGGNDLSVKYNDTWSWDGTSWTLLHSGAGTAPGTRTEHALAIDPINGTVLLFGGRGTGVFGAEYNDTWQFNTGSNTWVDVTPSPQLNVSQTHSTISAASNGMPLPQATINIANKVQPQPVDVGSVGFVSPVYILLSSGLQSVAFTGTLSHSLTGCSGGVGVLITGSYVFNLGGRYRHEMVLDEAHSRVMLFGGVSDQPGYLADTWAWDGTVWTMLSSGIQGTRHPNTRGDHRMVYDSNLAQVVSWGGHTFGTDSEHGGTGNYQVPDDNSSITWTWDGAGSGTWTRKRSGPLVTGGARMTYDSVRDRVVWFGGNVQLQFGGQISTDHTWELDCSTPEPTWSPKYALNAPPTGPGNSPYEMPVAIPTARHDHVMVFDPVNAVTLMFGGITRPAFSDVPVNDTWTYNGTAWTQLAPAMSPSARGYAAIAYDVANSKAVLYGGDAGSAETWTWNGTNWTNAAPATNPGPRQNHCMAYMPGVGVVLYGDQFSSSTDTWRWNGTNWSLLSTGGNPGGRSNATMIYNSARNLIMLVGGDYNFDAITWVFNGTDWQPDAQEFGQNVGPRNIYFGQSPAAAYDSAHDRAVFYADMQTWYSGHFNGLSSGFVVFDPIKTPDPSDPDPYVVFVTQFYDANNEQSNGLESLIAGSTPSAGATYGTLGLPFTVDPIIDGQRFVPVFASHYYSTFGDLAPGGLNIDPALGGDLARLLPLFWVNGDGAVKGESSLMYMPTHTYGYGGTAIDTTGVGSHDLIAVRAGLGGQSNRSFAFVWNGTLPLSSTDVNGPGSGNTEAFSGAVPYSTDFTRPDRPNNLKARVLAVPGVKMLGTAQAQVIDDGIQTQEPLMASGGGGSGLVVGSPILPGGS